MIISGKQHAANRQNAQHSSGPKTSAGKAASSLNAVTYGLRARSLLLAGETHEDYHQLCAALEAEWQPPVESKPIKATANSVQPPAPPSDYVMSGGVGDQPFCAPAATDSR
jgi:hypothetical protein